MSSGIPKGFLSFTQRGQPTSSVSGGGRLYLWNASVQTQIGYRLAVQAESELIVAVKHSLLYIL